MMGRQQTLRPQTFCNKPTFYLISHDHDRSSEQPCNTLNNDNHCTLVVTDDVTNTLP